MITRRSFLSALCALPFVGKLIPQKEPLKFHKDAFALVAAGEGYIRFGDRWFKFKGNSLYELRDDAVPEPIHRPRLTFAEWDRKYQG